jgi:hypothetical protein
LDCLVAGAAQLLRGDGALGEMSAAKGEASRLEIRQKERRGFCGDDGP